VFPYINITNIYVRAQTRVVGRKRKGHIMGEDREEKRGAERGAVGNGGKGVGQL
jgi:hypothetical protein